MLQQLQERAPIGAGVDVHVGGKCSDSDGRDGRCETPVSGPIADEGRGELMIDACGPNINSPQTRAKSWGKSRLPCV